VETNPLPRLFNLSTASIRAVRVLTISRAIGKVFCCTNGVLLARIPERHAASVQKEVTIMVAFTPAMDGLNVTIKGEYDMAWLEPHYLRVESGACPADNTQATECQAGIAKVGLSKSALPQACKKIDWRRNLTRHRLMSSSVLLEVKRGRSLRILRCARRDSCAHGGPEGSYDHENIGWYLEFIVRSMLVEGLQSMHRETLSAAQYPY
jgi:hypothetical protein